jgi:tRNA-splicing ligase RtcB
MLTKNDLHRIAPYLYEVPAALRPDMRVAARIYADEALLDAALADRSVEQLINTASLPGIVGYALAMPDVHQGYGFPIGGVAATALPDGVISPGGVGYDINCGVRLLASDIEAEALRPHIERLLATLFSQVPTGVGEGATTRLSKADLSAVLRQGAAWVVQHGQGDREDLEHTEDRGCMAAADPQALSPRALERGLTQLGSLGSGNHFIEIDEVVEVFDAEAADAMGLAVGRACLWLHCGSRGLGHQVCTDAVRSLQSVVQRLGIRLPDRELVCAPMSSPEGQQYYAAMCCAANYAWANRQALTHQVRQAFQQALGGRLPHLDLRVVYDVCHNIAKVEQHTVGTKSMALCVHRKGATRAFGPGQPGLPPDYAAIGQPVLIPGNMGDGCWVLVGTDTAMRETFGSCAHGAGRAMSRTEARKAVRGERLRAELEGQGIAVRSGSMSGLAEEAPAAYKDVDQVVNLVQQAGLAHKVARTRPLGVIKG